MKTTALALLARALLLPLCASAQRPSFRCPPAESLGVCSCEGSSGMVQCDALDDADDVTRSLASKFEGPIPHLKLMNGAFTSLNAGFLANVSVERLYISNGLLEEVSPNAFSGSPGLGLMMLTNNRLREVPSEALKKLTRLLTLSLFGNRISKLNGSSLAKLGNLKFLVLSNNCIEYIEPGVFSPSLEHLGLARNNLTSLNGAIRNLGSLEWLFAGSNQIESLAGELDGLVSLKVLNLEDNKLTSLEGAFKDLRSLKTLSLPNNWIEYIGEAFAPFKAPFASEPFQEPLGHAGASGVREPHAASVVRLVWKLFD
uniref:Putative membrane glycoprotein lig-1 n=1 Tax=Amblyomma triste TaxID=251400 RepID=A0A023GGU0_AMBTT